MERHREPLSAGDEAGDRAGGSTQARRVEWPTGPQLRVENIDALNDEPAGKQRPDLRSDSQVWNLDDDLELRLAPLAPLAPLALATRAFVDLDASDIENRREHRDFD